MCNFLTFVININRIIITSPIVNLLISRQSNLQQHTRTEEVKLQSNKVTLASPIQNLWFILFDRSSGRQSSLTVEPSRNSEEDIGAPGWASFLCYFLLLIIFQLVEERAKLLRANQKLTCSCNLGYR